LTELWSLWVWIKKWQGLKVIVGNDWVMLIIYDISAWIELVVVWVEMVSVLWYIKPSICCSNFLILHWYFFLDLSKASVKAPLAFLRSSIRSADCFCLNSEFLVIFSRVLSIEPQYHASKSVHLNQNLRGWIIFGKSLLCNLILSRYSAGLMSSLLIPL